MITHTEAQQLRGELYTLQTTRRFIAGKRGKAAKEQHIQLNAREEEIKEALKDAPPIAYSPLEIWDIVERWANRLMVKDQEARTEFLKMFETSPARAFGSMGQVVVVCSHQAYYVQQILKLNRDEISAGELLQALVKLGENLTNRILESTDSGFMRSTNSAGNLNELWELEAEAKLVDRLFGRWSGLQVNDLIASLQSWEEWQKEIEKGK